MINVQMKQDYPSEELKQRGLKILAQEAYCVNNKLPNFALNGRCYSCGRNVFDELTLEDATNTLITGCPNCHTSFCD